MGGLGGGRPARRGRRGRPGKLIAALRWHLLWSDKATWLRDLWDEEGGEAPLALVEQPEIPERLALAWQAFLDLSGDRQLGFGVIGEIPWTAIDAYARRHGIDDPDEFDALASHVKAMDQVFRGTLRATPPPRGQE
jgi:hypothetical protein